MVDVTIIGGGPAGLSAALVLGRCLRRVVVIDMGEGRNRHAREIHGYLTRDKVTPSTIISLGRREVSSYGVRVITGRAIHAERTARGTFRVRFIAPPSSTPRSIQSRKLLLATGMRDAIPPIENIERFYGSTVHHCPYCDGWEHRAQPIAAFGRGDKAVGLAISLRTWTQRVTACTNGIRPRAEMIARAQALRIPLRTQRVLRLEGDGPRLRQVVFDSGPPLRCSALFFNTAQAQRSDLPQLLQCQFKADGGVKTNDRQCSGVEGLYVCGDADREVQFLVVAAAQGATAAVAINGELSLEDEATVAPLPHPRVKRST